MILALLLLPLVAATPLHKYPYVFLLDVGNEELEKVNSEQIRLSSPGGSVALRYPAVGSGEDIAHVRVSGIDFGTDLKANILDGGPGYKYVVIVLIGNPGVAYDAVITVQTIPNEGGDDNKPIIEVPKQLDKYRPIIYDDSEEVNNSAEEYDSVESETSQVQINPKNEELSQESSNVYYSQNEALSGYGNGNENENSDDQSENDDNNDEQNVSETEESYNSENEVDYYNEEDSRVKEPLAERYTSNDYNQAQEDPVIVDQNLYNKYQALKSHFNGIEVYPQDSEISDYQSDFKPVDTEVSYEYEESDGLNYGNENYKDSDDATAVEF